MTTFVAFGRRNVWTTIPARSFERELMRYIDDGANVLLLDLSRLAFISSAGLRTLKAVSRRRKAERGRLALCALQAPVREAVDLTEAGIMFEIFPTVEAAIEHLSMR